MTNFSKRHTGGHHPRGLVNAPLEPKSSLRDLGGGRCTVQKRPLNLAKGYSCVCTSEESRSQPWGSAPSPNQALFWTAADASDGQSLFLLSHPTTYLPTRLPTYMSTYPRTFLYLGRKLCPTTAVHRALHLSRLTKPISGEEQTPQTVTAGVYSR